MKIVILDGYCENPGDLSWDALAALGELTVYDRTDDTDPAQIAQRIGDAEIIVINKTPITRQVIDACPSLRFITIMATGYNVVDCAYAAQKGIAVANVPAYGTAAVAQFAIALLLEICMHVGDHAEAVQEGRWAACADFCFWDTPLIELDGMTMGIIGFGRIGRQVGRIARAMGMRVLAYTRTETEEGRAIAEYVPLDTLLAEADVISLHCPLTDETRHMIDAAAIAGMKPGVVIVNTSRGALVDTEALIEGLRSRKIGAACLDVYEEEAELFYEDRSEAIIEDDTLVRLIAMPNVIVSSHQAFLTKEALNNIAAVTVDNLLKFGRGEPSPDTEVCAPKEQDQRRS